MFKVIRILNQIYLSSFLSLLFFLTLSESTNAQSHNLERRSYIKEEFFAFSKDRNYFDQGWYYKNTDINIAAQIWHKILLSRNIQNPTPHNDRWSTHCHYDTALKVLEDIRREIGINTLYEKVWLTNQNIVFSACDQRGNLDRAPSKPAYSNFPGRTISDYKYQLASWYFYNHYDQKALKIYREIENDLQAPLRPLASYMVMRLLSSMESHEAAYRKAIEILADPTLKPAHDITRNYRFILMYGHQNESEEIALEHLKWLMKVVRTDPENYPDLDDKLRDYFDAMHHLNNYFPLYSYKTKRIDWWLENYGQESPRMEAVKALYQRDDIVAWMQAKWARNRFDNGWLSALHEPESPYWEQNKNIVNYAWSRWNTGEGLEWLEITIQRIHPTDELSEKVLEDASSYLDRQWPDETDEFNMWFVNLWQHSLRLRLGREEYDQAYSLIEKHPNITYLEEPSQKEQRVYFRYRYRENYQTYQGLNNSIRWLIYNGELEWSRKFLKLAHHIHSKNLPQSFKHWDILLAETWEEVVEVAKPSRYSSHSNHNNLWLRMLNLLPSRELHKLVEEENISADIKARLSLSILTRALILNNKEHIDEYALTAIKYNPNYRHRILEGVSGHKKDNYIDLFLHSPRLRPVPFTMNANRYHAKELLAEQIDVFNHNDNNWWCRFDRDQLQQDVFREAVIRVGGIKSSNVQTTYIQKQKDILSKHPFNKLIDWQEIEALEAIPHAPKYLSEAVISRENWRWWQFWRGTKSRNKSASDLHHSVRTTRYGCQNNGSHASYSQRAFELLHDHYPNTAWAKATPYWFSDKHFR